MRIVLAALLLLSSPAFAQGADPFTIDLGALGAPAAPAADARWVAEDVTSTRFSDAADAGPSFTEGEQVTVLFTEGDRVRIRKGDRYGWVAKAAITDVRPANAAPATATPAVPGGTFDLEQLKGLLERTKAP